LAFPRAIPVAYRDQMKGAGSNWLVSRAVKFVVRVRPGGRRSALEEILRDRSDGS